MTVLKGREAMSSRPDVDFRAMAMQNPGMSTSANGVNWPALVPIGVGVIAWALTGKFEWLVGSAIGSAWIVGAWMMLTGRFSAGSGEGRSWNDRWEDDDRPPEEPLRINPANGYQMQSVNDQFDVGGNLYGTGRFD